MAVGIYQVVLYHPTTGATLDVIDSERWHTLTYERKLNDYGTMVMTIDKDDNAAQYAGTCDMLMEIKRKALGAIHWTTEAVFLHRLDDQFTDENDHDVVILGGFDLNHILKRRIIRPEDDPTNDPINTGYSTKYAAADIVMRELVLEQEVSPNNDATRSFPGLSVAGIVGIGNDVYIRERYTNLLDVLKNIAVRGAIDFEVTYTGGLTFLFAAHTIGSDKRLTTEHEITGNFLLFDPNRGNIMQPRLTRDRRDEITFVYVLGQGPEESRDVLARYKDEMNDSPWNRIEATTEAGNVDSGYIDGLITSGDEFLRDNQATVEFTFTPIVGTTDAVYRDDWDLGDLVTARYANHQEDLRITVVSVTVSGDGEIIIPTVAKLTQGNAI